MSEYQYYEFAALERPLNQQEMAALRALSTRARITPSGFVNEYHWGDLKADPDELLLKYFDAHVYVANWGEAIFKLRLPKSVLDKQTLLPFECEDFFTFKGKQQHWLLTWSLIESDDYDRFAMIEGTGWMGGLQGIRSEILRGDLRGLYIGWLAAAEAGQVDEEVREPILPTSSGGWTVSQLALGEFLGVSNDLLRVAQVPVDEPTEKREIATAIDQWLDGFTPERLRKAVREELIRQTSGKGAGAPQPFMEWRKFLDAAPALPRRSARELLQLAEEERKARHAREAREEALAEAQRQRAREEFLQQLYRQAPKFWHAANDAAATATAKGYEQAKEHLKDLADAYALRGEQAAYELKLNAFLDAHGKRAPLLKRLRTIELIK